MIYFEGLDSIIECIYLNETLNEKVGSCNVFVNPENIKYLIGRTIIINNCNYPKENIYNLLENRCKIISRIYTDITEVDIQPYIIRPNFYIMWNGRTLSDLSKINEDSWENGECSFDLKDYILYFPKISNTDDSRIIDSCGNLSAYGWALHQVGINLDTKTPFTNLDILKTKKIEF